MARPDARLVHFCPDALLPGSGRPTARDPLNVLAHVMSPHASLLVPPSKRDGGLSASLVQPLQPLECPVTSACRRLFSLKPDGACVTPTHEKGTSAVPVKGWLFQGKTIFGVPGGTTIHVPCRRTPFVRPLSRPGGHEKRLRNAPSRDDRLLGGKERKAVYRIGGDSDPARGANTTRYEFRPHTS